MPSLTHTGLDSNPSPENRTGRFLLRGMALPALIAAMLVFRGGFGGEITNACGCIAIGIGIGSLIKRKRGICSLGAIPLLFAGLAIAYFIGAGINGVMLTSLSEAGTWAGVAGASFLATLQDGEKRTRTLEWLCWLGIASAILGMLVFSGIVPWPGGVDADRLQFPMTYANSAGAWFGTVAFLCLLSRRTIARALSPLPVTALALTLSGGALAIFGIMAIALAIVWWKDGKHSIVVVAAVCMAFAAVLTIAVLKLPVLAAAACVIGAVVICAVSPKLARRFPISRIPTWAILAGLVLTIALCIVAIPSLTLRISDATDHFWERLIYAKDACVLLSTNPAFGVGPDCWQFLYQHVQTAPYRTTVVHCSYVQIALDSGIVGLCFLVVAMTLGLKRLARNRDTRCIIAAGLIILHSFIDFDLQFGALAFLLSFLLSAPTESAKTNAAGSSQIVQRLAALFLAVLLFGSCLLGLAASVAKSQTTLASSRGDWQVTTSLYERNPLAWNDPEMRAVFLEALRAQGRSAEAAHDVTTRGVWYDRQAIAGSQALYDVDDDKAGAAIMIAELEQSPYDAGLYAAAENLFATRGLPNEFATEYAEAVARSKQLMDN